MYRSLTIIILAACCTFFACTKEKPGNDNIIPSPATPSFDDRASVFLRNVVEQRLPSPLFHFVYNDSGYVTNIDFADGFFDYEVTYVNRRVAFMVNKKNGAQLDYLYKDGRVAAIEQNRDGQRRWRYKMFYADSKLIEVQWHRFQGAGDSILERKVELLYGADGNLSSYRDFWRSNGNELSLSTTFIFTDYDDGKNVDDFYLFKNFFEDLIFLPGIKLQKNNPRVVQRLGDQNDFEIKYTYTYNDSLPVQKNGVFKQTRGSGTGVETLVSSTYSYY